MNETEEMFTLDSAQPSTSAMKCEIPDTTQVVNLDNVQDFSNVCRICATITEFVIPIFAGEGLQNNLADKIQKHLPIKVSETDLLPQVVCYQCASTLLAWHELVACCHHADVALKARLAADTSLTTDKVPKAPIAKSNSTIEDDAQSKPLGLKAEENEVQNSEVMLINQSKPLGKRNDCKRTALCGICHKSISVLYWRRHLRLHSGERRYSCHTCGRAFADSGNLARHVKTLHGNLRPFSCPACSKTFSRRTHLNDHIKSHSEVREYVCDICGKGSKSSAALRMHARTHGARTLSCMDCGSAFKRMAELRAHMTVHTGERAHACSCGKTFRLRSQLNTHARTHRNIETHEDN